MSRPWYLLLAILLLFFTVRADHLPADLPPISHQDAFEFSFGTTILGSSPLQNGSTALDLFGATQSTLVEESGHTLFADYAPDQLSQVPVVDFVHFQTIGKIRLQGIRVVLARDGALP